MPKLTTWLRGLDSTAFGYLLGHVAQPDFGAAGRFLVMYQATYSELAHRFPCRLPISIPLKRTLIPA